MRLKLTLQRGDRADDLLVTADTTVTVGALAAAIAASDPHDGRFRDKPCVTLRVDGPGSSRVVPPMLTIGEAGVQSGQLVSMTTDAGAYSDAAQPRAMAAMIRVVVGPDAMTDFPLALGANQVGRGRGCDVRLSDPMVSKRHVRLNVTDVIEVIDLGSANGLLVGDVPVQRAVLRPSDVVAIGETAFQVVHHHGSASSVSTGPVVEFNRSPRLDPEYTGIELVAPEPPKPQQQNRFPFIPLVAPVLMGLIMYLISRNPLSVLFVALSPMMLIGSFFESRFAGKRAFEAAVSHFRAGLKDLAIQLNYAAELEAVARRAEHPSTTDAVAAVKALDPLTWTRRPDRRAFLDVRLGLGRRPSRNSVVTPTTNSTTPELWRELMATRDAFAYVDGVPVVAPLREVGVLGVAGARSGALGIARSVIGQLAATHSPAEVVLYAVASSASAPDWAWMRWLPHTSSEHAPTVGDQLAGSPGGCTRIVAALEELVDGRVGSGGGTPVVPDQAVVLLVEDDAPVERSRVVELAERGPRVGLHVVWLAPTTSRLPAACREFIEHDHRTGTARVGFVDDGSVVHDVLFDGLELSEAETLARALAPVVDTGARVDDESDLPRSVSLLSLVGLDAAESANFVVDQWRESDSLPVPADSAPKPRKRDATLRAVVGHGAAEPFVLDLRAHGPHALVGGTTGAGKSEFLQSWVLAMAMTHSPARVTFLFVDYKGGAAFSECIKLPHSVGLVTDLSPHLVRRALTSLKAELIHREEILNSRKAKDLLELERRGDPEAPPALVIVIDEFAALAKEVPEFVDGVVDVAQRGRSLGLHLILATQRPAGVIRDNLRANTNLRVALRMADEADSKDVVGTAQAALFDASIPGRAIAKLGPGRLWSFQSAYVGGRTAHEPPPSVINVEELGFGSGSRWEPPADVRVQPTDQGPNDLSRVVSTVCAAADTASVPAPRVPWKKELADIYDLSRLPDTTRSDGELIFGILDDPTRQDQRSVAFRPDHDGNMAVFGTGGSGKSTVLKTFAVVAGLGFRGGPCHVYALDFGSRSLAVLEALPHVGAVIGGEDDERVARLLRRLRDLLDERARRYINAGSITSYRTQAGHPDEPRVLLVVDNFGAFRQSYEGTALNPLYEIFQRLVGEGRQFGVHVMLTADRVGAVPSSLASSIQQRLVLRLAHENDYGMFSLPADVIRPTSPAGRGLYGKDEVQVAVLGGSHDTARQAAAIAQLGQQLRGAARWAPAPGVERLAERVTLAELPPLVGSEPVLGISDETLQPVGWTPDEMLLISGSQHSGRTNVLAAVLRSLRAARPGVQLIRFTPRRSQLSGLLDFARSVEGIEQASAAAKELALGMRSQAFDAAGAVLVIEQVTEYVNSPADAALQELVKACQDAGVVVIADSDVTTLGQTWPLLQLLKSARHGVALQPEQAEGESIFKTPFPKIGRGELPPGRGFYVRGGKAVKVQCAVVD